MFLEYVKFEVEILPRLLDSSAFLFLFVARKLKLKSKLLGNVQCSDMHVTESKRGGVRGRVRSSILSTSSSGYTCAKGGRYILFQTK